jgi:hypothetical protein
VPWCTGKITENQFEKADAPVTTAQRHFTAMPPRKGVVACGHFF